MTRLFPLVFLLIVCFFSCSRNDALQDSAIIDITDPVSQQIFNYKNARNSKEIIPFLSVSNPNRRLAAVKAFASLQDTNYITELARSLQDPIEIIRCNTAYSLGQTKHPSVVPYLQSAFAKDSSSLVKAYLLEAIGKTGSLNDLIDICTAKSYAKEDTVLRLGLAKALYRFAVQKTVHRMGTEKVFLDLLQSDFLDNTTAFYASAYLERKNVHSLTAYNKQLEKLVSNTKEPYTLGNFLTALAKTTTMSGLNLLKETYQSRDEHFVRGKIINALMYYPRDSIIGFVFNALSDSSLYVQECAAQYLRFNLPFSYYESALSAVQTCSSEKVRSLLFEAALNAIPAYRKALKSQLSFQIHSIITDSPSLYEKQFLIGSLSAYPENAARLMGYYRSLENPILKSAVVQACVRILSTPNSNENSQSFRRLYSFLFDVLQKGSPADKAIIGMYLQDVDSPLRDYYGLQTAIQQSLDSLTLPNDLETYYILQDVQSAVFDLDVQKPTSEVYTDIDWPVLNAMPNNEQVTLTINGKSFIFDLFKTAAPATVTQFINLIKSNYYTDKYIHRVVPNFVIQGGCLRGDGWSGIGITIPSEFDSEHLYDDAFYLGMASAGKDTESAQFFITTAPTPHLDGRYTIFGKSSRNYTNFSNLRVGDKIDAIKLN